MQSVVGMHLVDRSTEAHATALEGVDTVGEIQQSYILLGNEQREPLPAQVAITGLTILPSARLVTWRISMS
jgi:hypothetical protein